MKLLSWKLAILLCFLPSLSYASDRTLSIEQAAKELAGGGFVLMMRHAQTVPGTGDPAGFTLGNCATQRNLSEQGREQARRLGRQLGSAGIHFVQVRHSQWCRCRETAELAFGQTQEWAALNSFFADRNTEPGQTALVHEAAMKLAGEASGKGNVMWVTHQVNISAALGTPTRQGEIIAAKPHAGELTVMFRIAP